MTTTNHILARMSQRGISKKLIYLVYEYGKEKGDKLIFNKKTTQKVIQEIDSMRKELIRIMDKGGVTVMIHLLLLTTQTAIKETRSTF